MYSRELDDSFKSLEIDERELQVHKNRYLRKEREKALSKELLGQIFKPNLKKTREPTKVIHETNDVGDIETYFQNIITNIDKLNINDTLKTINVQNNVKSKSERDIRGDIPGFNTKQGTRAHTLKKTTKMANQENSDKV